MPKPEWRNPKEIQNPTQARLAFGFRASGFFRISSFGFRIYDSGLFRANWIAKLLKTFE
jgi:hypothetical protein